MAAPMNWIVPFSSRFIFRKFHARNQPNCLMSNISKRLFSFHGKFNKNNGNLRSFTTISAAVICTCGTIYLTKNWLKEWNIIPCITNVHAVELNGSSNLPSSKRNNFIADVVEKTAPAVVYIEVIGRHSFGTSMSNGSGFIIKENGLIVTNAHVVANNQRVSVKLQDGRIFEGIVEVLDQVSDLATIRINAKNLPTLPLGQSSILRPGEWVIAMGSPLNLSNTVTAGIISSVHRGTRELGIHNRDMEYIQTDAVINFGNSGGPLVNLDGEAIGINTMKVTTGISFAIPSDYVKKFLERAEAFAKRSERRSWFGVDKSTTAKKRYIGITMLTLTPSIISELQQRIVNFPDVTGGVFIHSIIVGSPAHVAGMQVGDVIVKINGTDIKTSTDVYKAVESGHKMKVVVKRGQTTKSLTVSLEEIPY
ncbi:hypothetical protein ACJMK2_006000 [Sinanodonta woodiana]|uniref:Serine protease HTRA2, mitochondrial n=1 Tax=Sinanodonta woodiana TaxID=1069815 RepID=A0ABD3VRU0_SINWO